MSFNIQVLEPNFKETLSGFQSLENYEERPKLLSEIVRCELMNLRTSNAHTKTRAEVSGGGKKPWKQKGTGRARHGSTRSPIWVGGGVAFGPRNTRNWSKKINKSARLAALKTIIKNRLEGNAIFQFVTNFDYPKTKGASEILETLTQKTEVKTKSTLVIYTQEDKEKLNGFPNTEAKMIDAANLKIHRLVNATNLIFTPAARDFLEKRLAENVTGEGAQKITPKKEVKAVEEKAAKAEKAVKKAPAKAVKTPETETKPKKAASVEKSEKAEKSETPKKKATSKAKEE